MLTIHYTFNEVASDCGILLTWNIDIKQRDYLESCHIVIS